MDGREQRVKLEAPRPVPIVIAALRDRMLRLGDGTFVNLLPLSATEHVVARVRDGEAGRHAMREGLHASAERGIATLVVTPNGADLIDELAP